MTGLVLTSSEATGSWSLSPLIGSRDSSEHSRPYSDVAKYILIYHIYYLCCLCIDFYDLFAWCGCWFVVYIREVYLHIFKCVSFWLHGCCGEWEEGPVNRLTTPVGWPVVTPTDRTKSVRNRCLIEVFMALFVLSLCPFDISVGVGAFVTGLSQISSFLSWKSIGIILSSWAICVQILLKIHFKTVLVSLWT